MDGLDSKPKPNIQPNEQWLRFDWVGSV